MQIYGVGHLACLFRDYNIKYFGGVLPTPYFRIMHGVNLLGLFTYSPGSVPGTTEVIDISDFYDYDGNQLRDLLVHEMIHYYIAVNQLRDTSTHGRLFRQEMKRINAEGNRHITISYRLSKEQLAALYPERTIF